MIISHRHRYIFFAVPKTGTHSVRQALRETMGEEDLEQVGLFVQKKFPFPELKNIQHGHINARQIRRVLGNEVFSSYFKFGFVRNPFDRFVSYCAFIGRGGSFAADPMAFMKRTAHETVPVRHILFRPQSEFLVDESGRLVMDMVGRTETMQDSFDKVCAALKLPTADLKRANASNHKPYQDYYDDELRGWVEQLYRKDLDMFSYKFDARPN